MSSHEMGENEEVDNFKFLGIIQKLFLHEKRCEAP